MTSDDQLKAWVEGNPIHNHDREIEIVDDAGKVIRKEKLVGGECCPDFSCCHPERLWPLELREKFAAASTEVRHQMLMMELGKLAVETGCNVRIAGDGSQTLQ